MSLIVVFIGWLLSSIHVFVVCNIQKQRDGHYYLSARTIAELEPYLLDQFAVCKCNVCQKLCVQVSILRLMTV